MLTFACTRALRVSRSKVLAAAVLVLPLLASAAARPAEAEGVRVNGCVGTWHASGCTTVWAPLGGTYIRKVPQPVSAEERARAAEEDRRWVARCRPTLRQDRYGVARYQYARPGCEFGVGEY